MVEQEEKEEAEQKEKDEAQRQEREEEKKKDDARKHHEQLLKELTDESNTQLKFVSSQWIRDTQLVQVSSDLME